MDNKADLRCGTSTAIARSPMLRASALRSTPDGKETLRSGATFLSVLRSVSEAQAEHHFQISHDRQEGRESEGESNVAAVHTSGLGIDVAT